MDFGYLILVVPLIWFVIYQAKEATNETTPKGEAKTGTFIMFVIVFSVLLVGAFIITGFGSSR